MHKTVTPTLVQCSTRICVTDVLKNPVNSSDGMTFGLFLLQQHPHSLPQLKNVEHTGDTARWAVETRRGTRRREEEEQKRSEEERTGAETVSEL